MSSASGPRAKGTDGKDYVHRETVASHYATSSINKARLRSCLLFHVAVYALMVLRLSTSIMGLLGWPQPAALLKLMLPKAELWEFVWLFSALPALLTLMAIPRNKTSLLRQAIFGQIIFGVAPLLCAMYDIIVSYAFPTDLASVPTTSNITLFRWAWLAVALQVHGFAVYFASQLLTAWNPANMKKKM